MLKSLITYLNLKLDLLNYFDLTRCLVELKEDSEGTKQPVEYISSGDYDVIDWDEFNGVSYWRLRDEITSDRTEERKYKAGSRNNIETTIPLKLVFAVPRTKLTEDDAYSFDRIRQTMVKQFAIDDDVIKTTLQAESVRINVVTANSDAKEVWEEETDGTGTFEPKYETIFGSIDVDVVIISKHSCLPTECDDVESDIIRAFNWCGNTAVTIGRLTEAQQDCISDFLCGSPDPVQIQVNGVNTDTAASGTTYDQEIENTDGTAVGTAANPSVVGDVQIQVNGVNTDTAPAETTYNQQILNLNGDVMGNEANPSIIGNTTIRNQANDWSDTEFAEGTYTLGLQRVVDSDGSNVDTVDYKPIADGAVFTCTPADYGTRILSVLRRQYCVDALCGFSLRYIDDEWAAAGMPVIRVRRDGDNAEADFTPTEISDGTLVAWVVAGGGTETGYIQRFYDQTFNYFELFQNTALSQAEIVKFGVLFGDSQGNPVAITTSTTGYQIGANGSNPSRLTLFSPNGGLWAVGRKNNSTSISRLISNGGNPAVGIADTTSNPNDIGTGTPTTYSNGSALADSNRDTLQTAINNTEFAVLMTDCDWTDSANWRLQQGILAFQAFPVGSQISEFVLDKKNWTSATIVNEIYSDLQGYYGYW